MHYFSVKSIGSVAAATKGVTRVSSREKLSPHETVSPCEIYACGGRRSRVAAATKLSQM